MSPDGPVDLLVFGPHPDDIEIGMAGTIARHTSLGHRVGLCDLTAGEMGSNGTVEARRAESEAAAVVLGVCWRINLGLPDRAIGSSPEHVSRVAALVRRSRPRTVPRARPGSRRGRATTSSTIMPRRLSSWT
jgi:LmbE family N-acetylglucosaminyl deacetylase